MQAVVVHMLEPGKEEAADGARTSRAPARAVFDAKKRAEEKAAAKKGKRQKATLYACLGLLALVLCAWYIDHDQPTLPAALSSPQASGAALLKTCRVTVRGEVRNPGEYLVYVTELVGMAIERAGGATENADLGSMAWDVKDIVCEGMVIIVPEKGEKAGQERYGLRDKDGRLNINIATYEEMMSVPGMTQEMAMGILAHQQYERPFVDMADMLAVPGVTEAWLTALRPHIFLGFWEAEAP